MLVAQDSNVECAVSTSLRSALANKKEMSDRKRCSTTGPNKFVMRKLEVGCPFGVRNDSGSYVHHEVTGTNRSEQRRSFLSRVVRRILVPEFVSQQTLAPACFWAVAGSGERNGGGLLVGPVVSGGFGFGFHRY